MIHVNKDDIEVSIIMPNFNCAPYVEHSIRSAMAQTVPGIEVIFVDDCSTDESAARARAVAADWPDRVRVFVQDRNQGSAAARNRALTEARGRWLAVLDSDDLIYPDRIRSMIALAEEKGADIVSDDMLTFYDDHSRPPHRLLVGPFSEGDRWVSLSTFVEENRFYAKNTALGYLKPVIRADRWREAGVFYDETLRLAQDYDFVLRLLEAGLTYLVSPRPWYFYRKHTASNSHRTKPGHVEALYASDLRFRDRLKPEDVETRAALDRREVSILDTLAFDRLVQAVKAKDFAAAAKVAVERPRILRLLKGPLDVRLERMKASAGPEPVTEPTAMIITARPLDRLGDPDLAAAARAFHDQGLRVELVCPCQTSADGGAAPALPDFDAVHVRRGAGGRSGVGDMTAEDIVFLAQHTPRNCAAIAVAEPDWVFAASFAIRPDTPVTTINPAIPDPVSTKSAARAGGRR
jgi:succinoglycan biosynthesis protein ExoO